MLYYLALIRPDGWAKSVVWMKARWRGSPIGRQSRRVGNRIGITWTCWLALMVRSWLQNGKFVGFRHCQSISMGNLWVNQSGEPSYTICYFAELCFEGSRWYWMGLGCMLCLPSGLNHCITHPGQANPPVAQGRSLAGCLTGWVSGQGFH